MSSIKHNSEQADAEIAALKQHIVELKAERGIAYQLATDFQEQLAAAQSREVKLREALSWLILNRRSSDAGDVIRQALSIPSDTTALQQALAAERERCAVVAEKSEWIAAQIRSMK